MAPIETSAEVNPSRKNKARSWAILKALVSIAVVGGAAAYLLGGSFRQSLVYDRSVDELIEQQQELRGQQVRVGGKLVPQSHSIREGTTDHEFVLSGNDHTVNVLFTGLWPDAATDGRELMIEGTFGENGVLAADRVLTRCPSRYKRRVSEE